MNSFLFSILVSLIVSFSVHNSSAENFTFIDTDYTTIKTVDSNGLWSHLSKANTPLSGINRQSRPFSLIDDKNQNQYNRTQSAYGIKWPRFSVAPLQLAAAIELLLSKSVDVDFSVKKIIYPFHTFL